MPTYEYRCSACDHRFERFQKMSDEAVRDCESCGGEVQRVLFPVAVHFKGSGFYTTDYARKKTMCAGGNGNGAGTAEGSGETKGGDDKAPTAVKAGAAADKPGSSSSD